MSQCSYIFLDEAGNFDFSTKGTQYFVLTSVSMDRPFKVHVPLDDYKHDCLEFGLNTEYFHCSHDNPKIRDQIFDLISNHLAGMKIDSLIIEKNKTGPALREDGRFYPEMLGHLLKFVLSREVKNGAEEVIVITDTIPVQSKRQAIEKAVQQSLAKMLPEGMRYRILHHASRSHYGLQVADYCCWAIFRKWQKGEKKYYDWIQKGIRSEFDIFRTGQRSYY
jgi:hypothetical protein